MAFVWAFIWSLEYLSAHWERKARAQFERELTEEREPERRRFRR